MGSRVGTLIAFVVVLAAGVLLGSGFVEWFGVGGGEAGGVTAAPDAPSTSPPPPEVEALGRVTVEVLNAGGREGMAREATERLRERGFDVVSFGNAAEFGQAESLVLDRVERPEAARAVARALGIGEVRSEPDPNLLVDVTVRIGSRWGPDEGSTSAGAEGEGRPWWDVRRYLPDDAGE